MENKYYYTDAVIETIKNNREQFESMLTSLVETPFQSEHGDVWVTKGLAMEVCYELINMNIDKEMSDQDFKLLAENEDDELLHIVF